MFYTHLSQTQKIQERLDQDDQIAASKRVPDVSRNYLMRQSALLLWKRNFNFVIIGTTAPMTCIGAKNNLERVVFRVLAAKRQCNFEIISHLTTEPRFLDETLRSTVLEVVQEANVPVNATLTTLQTNLNTLTDRIQALMMFQTFATGELTRVNNCEGRKWLWKVN
ncbi:hypothetical protein Tco_0921422 [Tanacetum coccineum]